MDDILISRGGALKSLGDNRVGGYLVVFGDPEHHDLDGDWFSPDTDFDMENGAKKSGFFNHGLDVEVKNTKIGRGTLTKDETGIYLDAELKVFDADKWTAEKKAERQQYIDAVLKLVADGECGLSSGAVSHLVRREKTGKSFHVTDWPLGEWSITHHPAEPRTKVLPIKAWKASSPSLKDMLNKHFPQVETKGVLLPGSEENMLLNALQSLNSMFLRFVMQAVGGQDWQSDLYGWDSYYGSQPDPDDGEEINADKVRAAFDEYRDTALAAIEALSKKPEAKAAQDLLNLFKEPSERDVVTALKMQQISNYLRTMGSVVGEFDRRLAWYAENRNVKSGRTISAANLATLKGIRDGMTEHLGTLHKVIDANDPDADSDNDNDTLSEAAESAYLDFLSGRMLAVSAR